MISVITEDKMPKTFTGLLGNFARTYEEEPAPTTFQNYVRWRMKQTYPLLDETAISIERRTKVKINRINSFGREVSEKVLADYISLLNLRYAPATITQREKGYDWQLSERKKFKFKFNQFQTQIMQKLKNRKQLDPNTQPQVTKADLTLPLFAITNKTKYNTKGVVSCSVPLDLRAQVGDQGQTYIDLGKMQFRMPVDIEVTAPIAPAEVKNALPAALAIYYQAVGEAVSAVDAQSPKVFPATTEVLGVPTVETLNISSTFPKPTIRRPAYSDPALILKCGSDRYIIGLWDDENAEVGNIEDIVREWSEGSFEKLIQ